jgi:hypothetical protein
VTLLLLRYFADETSKAANGSFDVETIISVNHQVCDAQNFMFLSLFSSW